MILFLSTDRNQSGFLRPIRNISQRYVTESKFLNNPPNLKFTPALRPRRRSVLLAGKLNAQGDWTGLYLSSRGKIGSAAREPRLCARSGFPHSAQHDRRRVCRPKQFLNAQPCVRGLTGSRLVLSFSFWCGRRLTSVSNG